MAFLVEDGTRIDGANALTSVAFADDYHTDRGRISWLAFDTTKKQQCLIRATDYLQKRFSRRWKGARISPTQTLDWPRLGIWDNNLLLIVQSNEIPRKLQQAVSEYALRAGLVGELVPDPVPLVPPQNLGVTTPTTSTEFVGGLVKSVEERVEGAVDEKKTYVGPSELIQLQRNKSPLSDLVTDALIPEYPAADMLLEDFLQSNSRRLARG